FFSSRRRHTRSKRDWSSDVCSSDLFAHRHAAQRNHTVNMAVNRHDFVSLIQAGNQELIAGFLGGVALEVALVAGIADIHREKTRSEERRVGKERTDRRREAKGVKND